VSTADVIVTDLHDPLPVAPLENALEFDEAVYEAVDKMRGDRLGLGRSPLNSVRMLRECHELPILTQDSSLRSLFVVPEC
jgi:hypothetical protein